ncbi:Cell surface glycoprotein MUC18 [Myotis brandtii]|uniref:Cell surface glycoprotein MUC18 n=1 Tax=Myotis brandtii TaxID=109478 RepID=S7MC34_MYOBR|nr:Cell surface glycoprotein MUC18 [Myotis brandtii]
MTCLPPLRSPRAPSPTVVPGEKPFPRAPPFPRPLSCQPLASLPPPRTLPPSHKSTFVVEVKSDKLPEEMGLLQGSRADQRAPGDQVGAAAAGGPRPRTNSVLVLLPETGAGRSRLLTLLTGGRARPVAEGPEQDPPARPAAPPGSSAAALVPPPCWCSPPARHRLHTLLSFPFAGGEIHRSEALARRWTPSCPRALLARGPSTQDTQDGHHSLPPAPPPPFCRASGLAGTRAQGPGGPSSGPHYPRVEWRSPQAASVQERGEFCRNISAQLWTKAPPSTHSMESGACLSQGTSCPSCLPSSAVWLQGGAESGPGSSCPPAGVPFVTPFPGWSQELVPSLQMGAPCPSSEGAAAS